MLACDEDHPSARNSLILLLDPDSVEKALDVLATGCLSLLYSFLSKNISNTSAVKSNS